jgi:GH18 family chitinase
MAVVACIEIPVTQPSKTRVQPSEMPLTRFFLSALLITAVIPLITKPARAQSNANAKVIAYVPNWIDLDAFSKTIDYPRLTHINLAFENPTGESGDLSYNPKNDVLIAAAHTRGIPVSISIGGGAASSDAAMTALYATLLTDTNRPAFVGKLAAYVTAHNFDGIDVDLEGPAIGKDYGAFIKDLGRAIKPARKLLTAALSQGYGGNQVPRSVFKTFDWVNIMAYDGTGPWSPNAPGPHSTFQYAKSNVEYWLSRGLPRRKAVLGVPFYGWGFGPAFRPNEYSYSAILSAYPGSAQVDQAGNTIWYNGIPTIKAKAQWAREQKLGGVMIWSLDGDAKGENSLLTALADTLKPQ